MGEKRIRRDNDGLNGSDAVGAATWISIPGRRADPFMIGFRRRKVKLTASRLPVLVRGSGLPLFPATI